MNEIKEEIIEKLDNSSKFQLKIIQFVLSYKNPNEFIRDFFLDPGLDLTLELPYNYSEGKFYQRYIQKLDPKSLNIIKGIRRDIYYSCSSVLNKLNTMFHQYNVVKQSMSPASEIEVVIQKLNVLRYIQLSENISDEDPLFIYYNERRNNLLAQIEANKLASLSNQNYFNENKKIKRFNFRMPSYKFDFLVNQLLISGFIEDESLFDNLFSRALDNGEKKDYKKKIEKVLWLGDACQLTYFIHLLMLNESISKERSVYKKIATFFITEKGPISNKGQSEDYREETKPCLDPKTLKPIKGSSRYHLLIDIWNLLHL